VLAGQCPRTCLRRSAGGQTTSTSRDSVRTMGVACQHGRPVSAGVGRTVLFVMTLASIGDATRCYSFRVNIQPSHGHEVACAFTFTLFWAIGS
jgi:hypothetical protein